MKRNSPERIHYFEILRGQKDRYQKKPNKPRRKEMLGGRTKVTAPPVIDLYNPRHHKKLTKFLSDVRQAITTKKGVYICLRDTHAITASGGILFLSEIDRLVNRFGTAKIRASIPKPIADNFGGKRRVAQAVLQKIGFYRLLKMSTGYAGEYEHVRCWDCVSGTMADGSLIGHLLKNVKSYINATRQRSLYRGACEALSNSCEHAYTGIRNDGLNIEDKRWWMFTAIRDGKLTVLVCDLGIGIPNTIHKTQSSNLLDKIFKIIGYNASTDGAWIQTATLVKRTRTQESHRGKGGSDLRMLVENDPEAVLSIFSNRGRFHLSEKGEKVLDYTNSIYGTIVEWSIKVKS